MLFNGLKKGIEEGIKEGLDASLPSLFKTIQVNTAVGLLEAIAESFAKNPKGLFTGETLAKYYLGMAKSIKDGKHS